MITGSIKTHDEPEKTPKSTFKQPGGWGWMYESEWDQNDYAQQWRANDDALLKELNKGTLAGLVIGARVKRAGGNPGTGTVTHIHRTHTMAYNATNGEIEPFKVTWDKTGNYTGGSFDYCADDLVVLDKENLPTIIKEIKNETVSHLCQSR